MGVGFIRGGEALALISFTPEELEELKRIDAMIDADEDLTDEDIIQAWKDERESQKKTPAKYRASSRRWYYQHREELLEKARVRNAQKREYMKQYRKDYYRKNREAILAYQRKYHREHRSEILDYKKRKKENQNDERTGKAAGHGRTDTAQAAQGSC
jgi:superfamily II DNA/RNA helicase